MTGTFVPRDDRGFSLKIWIFERKEMRLFRFFEFYQFSVCERLFLALFRILLPWPPPIVWKKQKKRIIFLLFAVFAL
jgi:hypothetical protein